jgi:hypothetical protein
MVGCLQDRGHSTQIHTLGSLMSALARFRHLDRSDRKGDFSGTPKNDIPEDIEFGMSKTPASQVERLYGNWTGALLGTSTPVTNAESVLSNNWRSAGC